MEHLKPNQKIARLAQARVTKIFKKANTGADWHYNVGPQFPITYQVTDGKTVTEYKINDGKIDWTSANTTIKAEKSYIGDFATLENILSKKFTLSFLGRRDNMDRAKYKL